MMSPREAGNTREKFYCLCLEDCIVVCLLSMAQYIGLLFPINGITELVDPPKNIFGLAELQLFFWGGDDNYLLFAFKLQTSQHLILNLLHLK